MQIVAHLNVAPLTDLLEERGLDDGGKAQQVVDSECIRLMDDYTPMDTGQLKRSVRANTVIGSGELIQATPYARYLYYGKLMVDPKTGKGSFYNPNTGEHWSRPGVSKVLTNRDLNFNQTKSPQAGPHWFERMVKDHKQEIGEAAAKTAGGEFKG